MIPQRLAFHTFSFVMSLLMSGIMSLSLLAPDSTELIETLTNWPKAWAIAMLVAFPVSLFVVPVTQRLVAKMVAEE
ncbi:MAG: DUF2798 domain-containing protein [Alteromonadaceae bacterium]|nr:DUF2798 domain-containing protein [Alteromonadaceae bacterium]